MDVSLTLASQLRAQAMPQFFTLTKSCMSWKPATWPLLRCRALFVSFIAYCLVLADDQKQDDAARASWAALQHTGTVMTICKVRKSRSSAYIMLRPCAGTRGASSSVSAATSAGRWRRRSLCSKSLCSRHLGSAWAQDSDRAH